jgi:hypothetical protein
MTIKTLATLLGVRKGMGDLIIQYANEDVTLGAIISCVTTFGLKGTTPVL